MIFYDTNYLMNALEEAFDTTERFSISSMTYKELEHIKTAYNKDPESKYRARVLGNLLIEHEGEYDEVLYKYEDLLSSYPQLDTSNDSKIILTAFMLSQTQPVTFVTQDLFCYGIAKSFINDNFKVEYRKEIDEDTYTGFKEITCDNDQLATFYNSINDQNQNVYDMLVNQYLILKDTTGKVVDQYKYTSDGFVQVPFITFKSKMFGTVKPRDIYQQLFMDSLSKNSITMVRGAAGTGKTYLSFGYLFQKLEAGEIDKIIVFCNTVATRGAAKLGFYPGPREEKLLDSQIGNLLTSKLGSRLAVERLLDEGKLVLLPLADIRGYDTTGMKAGVYISEAQNLDIELMRLALQRVGSDAICIIDGDDKAQVDLQMYAGNNNGMKRVSKVFRDDSCYGELTLQIIYRHHITALAQKM